MPAVPATPDAPLTCATCGYDLRTQPAEGVCPECATPVAQSIRVAALPLRPAWADCDPRWRRRILAGLWVLVLSILLFGFSPGGLERWANAHPVFDRLAWRVAPSILVGIGTILLLSDERHDRVWWWRRWKPWARRVAFVAIAAAWVGLLAFNLRYLLNSAARAGTPALLPKWMPNVLGDVYEQGGWIWAVLTLPVVAFFFVALWDVARRVPGRTGALIVVVVGAGSVSAETWRHALIYVGRSFPLDVPVTDEVLSLRLNLLACGFHPTYFTPGEDTYWWWLELAKATLVVLMAARLTVAQSRSSRRPASPS